MKDNSRIISWRQLEVMPQYTSLGVSLLEYMIVVVVLGVVLYFISLEFKPKSQSFFNDVTPGLSVEYPIGYTEKSL